MPFFAKGNQQTFLEHPKVTAKAMNKEERVAMSYLLDIGSSISHCTVAQRPKKFARNMASTESSLIHRCNQGQMKLY
jgi:hypothetical protein